MGAGRFRARRSKTTTTTPAAASTPPSPYAIASDIAQPKSASVSGSTNPLEVNLVAGEEEQHAETKVREEPSEPVDLRDAKPLRPNHHTEDELEHDHRKKQATSARHRGDRARHRRGHHDREKDPVSTLKTFPVTPATNTIAPLFMDAAQPPSRHHSGPGNRTRQVERSSRSSHADQ